MANTHRSASASAIPGTVARLVAAAAVLVSGLVHLQLYFDGYRDYPDANLGQVVPGQRHRRGGAGRGVGAPPGGARAPRRGRAARRHVGRLRAQPFRRRVFGFPRVASTRRRRQRSPSSPRSSGWWRWRRRSSPASVPDANCGWRRRSPRRGRDRHRHRRRRRCGRAATAARPSLRAARPQSGSPTSRSSRARPRSRWAPSVEWVNEDGFAHTIVAEDGSFQSPDVDAGGTFSFTFTEPGTYAYICSIHPSMHGTIVVTS